MDTVGSETITVHRDAERTVCAGQLAIELERYRDIIGNGVSVTQAWHRHGSWIHLDANQAHATRTRGIALDPALVRKRLKIFRNGFCTLDTEAFSNLTYRRLIRVLAQVLYEKIENSA